MNASFILRLKAFFFDYLWILLYLAAVFAGTVFVFPPLQQLFQGSAVTAQLTGILLVTLPVSLYFIIGDSRLIGQSFGKKKVNIQVVDSKGKPLSFAHSAVRVLLKFLPWELSHFLVYRLVYIEGNVPLHLTILGISIYILIFVYILTALFTRKKQALYDILCKTEVVPHVKSTYRHKN
ncbi:RDD family protein [Alkalicoccus daliensis]|uniref:RDD family protein n=1 Tax=Alkalicoccus daliensis TaxID=745820 RepID=A0A1H0EQL7_9BACI|nr:RDD family protein [Alkalicoccus daliensis]SDN84599.1 RDD family protein [Alkalicoccus daliensis]